MIPEKITKIEQKKFLCGRQKFEIREDGEMEVTVSRLWMHNQFKFPLWALNPSPTRVKFVQVGSLVGSIIFALCTACVIVGMVVSRDDLGTDLALLFPLFLFGAVFGACIWKLKTQSVNANVYHYRDGGGRLHIWFENPDPKAFKDFCETLTRKADEAWAHRPIEPSSQSLAGELAALKKLKDSGVLNEAEFERAKNKLLGQTEQGRIGFV
jgi:hypothetical protein